MAIAAPGSFVWLARHELRLAWRGRSKGRARWLALVMLAIYAVSGCVTAYGNGVGPATQAGFSPAAGGHLIAPTANEANVELPATTGPSASAALRQPAQSQWALVGVGGLLIPVLLLAWGARPSRRRARRRA